ncbi:unnamed protein product [Phaedon cochleariae]|uniref:Amine oxidase n=1 Tax=Phaedon cochleariae TaxID=80249 RepID=A0A9P0DCJ9_PHACE|nr:unnamed protein product [Phaedon cochleariae]
MFKIIDADVIVIGAGLSGLTAAYQLLEKEQCLRVMVLESSKRMGGRLFQVPLSVRDGKSLMCFNIGGSWLSREQNIFLSFLEKLGISIVNSRTNPGKIIVEYDDNIHLLDSKCDIMNFLTFSEKVQLTKFILKVEIICRNIRQKNEPNWFNELEKTRLKTFIQRSINSEGLLLIIDFMIFLYCGVDTSQVSALFYIFFCISTKGIINQLLNETKNLYEFKMKNSSKDICDILADEIGREYILKEQRVLEISCKEKYVEVITDEYSYCCFNVIVAVSPEDILKIKFSPDLSKETHQSLTGMSSHPVTTFLVTYQKEFWQEKQLSGDIYIFDRFHRKGLIDFCWNISNLNMPVLYGRIFTSGAIPQNKQATDIYKERILEELSEFLGEEASYPTDYYEKTWYGNSCQMFCGQSGIIMNDEKRINDRIYWAGAETSAEWYGQLAGAVNSGIKAALEVLYDLRPSVLTTDDLIFLRPTQRSLKKSPREYESPIYSIMGYVANWKTYLPLSLLMIFVLWRIKLLIIN